MRLLTTIISACTILSMVTVNANAHGDGYHHFKKVLISVEQRHSLKLMKRYISAIKRNVLPTNSVGYSRLALDVIQCLRNCEFDEAGQDRLAAQLAWHTMKTVRHIPPKTKVQILLQIQSDTKPNGYHVSNNKGWPAERRARARIWLNTMHEIQEKIDPNWNASDVPMINVPPPPGTSGFAMAGMDPANIKDADLRSQYVSALRTNAKKAQHYREQKYSRQLKVRFFPVAEQYLTKIFSRVPIHVEKVKRLLHRYDMDNHIIKKITAAIKTAENS